MWGSKGRSGYGDSTIGGDYDSWDGLARNGRQYKNEITQETRDLSGADYWNLRKQNRPTEEIPEHIHMLNKNRANIEAYADKPAQVKPKSSVSIRDKILPQCRRVNTLTDQIIELENAYKSGEMSQAEYTMLRAVLYVKRDRSIELYKKAINVAQSRNELAEDSVESDTQNGDSCSRTAQQEQIVTGTFLDEISSTNSLKLFAQRGLQLGRMLVRWVIKTKQYINELKAV